MIRPRFGVVLGIGRRHQQHVQRQPEGVAADLDVALLHHVEQRDLDALGQVGELVDGHDPAVRARHQAEVDGLRIAERTALRHLDRVDVADQVGDGSVRRGQLLGVPLAAVLPHHRQLVAQFPGEADGLGRDGCVGVLADLGAGDHRGPFVEQVGQAAEQPGLALAALPEQHDVVSRDQGPFQLGQHGRAEADDAHPRVAPGAQGGEQIGPDLGLDAEHPVAGGAQVGEGGGKLWGRCVRHVSRRYAWVFSARLHPRSPQVSASFPDRCRGQAGTWYVGTTIALARVWKTRLNDR